MLAMSEDELHLVLLCCLLLYTTPIRAVDILCIHQNVFEEAMTNPVKF